MEAEKNSRKENRANIHLLLEDHHLLDIHKVFMAQENGSLNQTALKTLLKEIASLQFDDNEFEIMFLQMNTKRDGLVTWDEFISHLILGFKHQEVVAEFQDLDPPISKAPRILKSNHRHPINRISFYATMSPNRTTNFLDGSYMTCSKDGYINYWSLDWSLECTVQSKCPDLKVSDTWVIDIITLPDVSVVCTCSSERDLRFYDSSARKFDLRVIFTSLDYAATTMSYVFNQDPNKESKLILGDMGGNIKVIKFSSVARGPFKSKLGKPLMRARYERVLKGAVPGFKIVEIRNVHTDWVRQVAYYPSLHFIVSCSACPKAAIQMRDMYDVKGGYTYKIAKGAYCFALAEGVHLMASGSPDCLVRLWNPFVPKRPSIVFPGHHAGIIGIMFQDGAKTLCSISKDKCIKVWDVAAQTNLQTYTGLPSELGEHTDLCFLYNPDSRQLIIGSVMIAVLPLCPKQSEEHTDGNTHCSPISVLLYNPLFQIILTCGLDSFIIVWDPWNGRRISVVKEAHTRTLRGEILPVEITAATFDPGYQLLLTGAHDGSLKTWNFNTGTCLRNMKIEKNCEVTGVVWVPGRILAIGWNRHVTEFADSGGHAGPGGAFSKSWETNHMEDVLCTAARVPQTLVTSSYSGELVMWQLETGQAYKSYNVSEPNVRIKLTYKGRKASPKAAQKLRPVHESSKKLPGRTSNKGDEFGVNAFHPQISASVESKEAKKARRLTVVMMPKIVTKSATSLPVRAMLFLTSRTMSPKIGSLLVGLENGCIQVWSHHPSGAFISSFSAIHKGGDYVVTMASDEANEFLFTGTTNGYIKTWLIKDYCVGDEEIKICIHLYRLKFPFMWKDLFEGKAKRANRGQPKPVLLNCYRGHRMLVSGLVYIDKPQILVSASADFSARLWTLGGRYLGTLGTYKPWKPLDPDKPPRLNFEYTIPPDIMRISSSTTFKVLQGGEIQHRLTNKQLKAEQKRDFVITDVTKGVYGKRLEEPILGRYYHMPERTTQRHEFELDTSFPYIPVYQHMITPPPHRLPFAESPNDKDKDQCSMNKVLRSIVDAPWYIRNNNLHRDLDVETVDQAIKKYAQSHEQRLSRHVNPEVLQLPDNADIKRSTKPFELV